MRRLQEVVFLEKQNVTEESVLIQCAKHVGLDVNEFVKDLHSDYAAKAFQCDLKITSEMDVDEIPTLVFFNEKLKKKALRYQDTIRTKHMYTSLKRC